MKANEDDGQSTDPDEGDNTDDPAEPDTIAAAECDLKNVYSGYFPEEKIGDVDYKIVPEGLVAYVQLNITTFTQKHAKIVIDLEGL